MLLCENGNYYTGYTSDLARRYQEHVTGSSKCKYTRSFKPMGLMQSWQAQNKSMAMKMESIIKRMTKKEKQQLILFPELLKSKIVEE